MGLVKNKTYHLVGEEIMKQIKFKSKCEISKVDATDFSIKIAQFRYE
jgi:hypothetical protein